MGYKKIRLHWSKINSETIDQNWALNTQDDFSAVFFDTKK